MTNFSKRQKFMSFQVFRYFSNRTTLLILFGIITAYLINGIFYLNAQSLTSDEAGFYNYAVRFLKGNPERINPVMDNSKMPVNVLNTIPRIVEDYILDARPVKDGGERDITNGRYITLFISVLSILFVFVWTKELYGEKAGLFSAFLFSLCPNHLANAGLVTTDAYSVLFLLATFYFFWKFCNTAKQKYFLFFSISIGVSQLVKQSLFHLYPLTALCGLVFFAYKDPIQWKWEMFFKRVALFILINWLIINAGYYFHNSFWTLGDYNFMSNLFQKVQSFLPSSLLIPFPKPFVDGLDMTKYYDQIGGGTPISSFGNVTILGESRTAEGFWYYYFVSILFKFPIAYFIILTWSVLIWIRSERNKKFIQNEFFLLIPVVYFLLVMSFFYKTQCGVRHIVFLIPMLLIFCGNILPFLKSAGKRMLLGAVSIFLLISTLSYFRNYYPYTNEFILNKKNAYRYVGSQNLDFLQGGFFLARYLMANQGVLPAPKTQHPGQYVIAIHDYMDTWNKHEFEWLKCYKPVGHVAHCYLLIDARRPCSNLH